MHYDFIDLFVAVPKEIPIKEVSAEIEKLSPNFFFIYRQALAAESLQLTQITGLGLRKHSSSLLKIMLYQSTRKKKRLSKDVNECWSMDFVQTVYSTGDVFER